MQRYGPFCLLIAGSGVAFWDLSHAYCHGRLGLNMQTLGWFGCRLAGSAAVSCFLSACNSSDMSRLPSWLGGNKKIVDELQVSKKKQQPPEPRPRPRLPKPVLGKDNIMVLSIDGGGIRGLIPASVLTNLEDLLQVI